MTLRVHGLLPSPRSSSEYQVFCTIPLEHPIIRRPEELAADPVIGLPSPEALEYPPGVSRALSSAAVTSEPDPGCGPSISGASSSDIRGGSSEGSSTSIGWRTLLTADAYSDWAYQSSVMLVTSWMPSSSPIDCFELAGVLYLMASCSSGAFR